MSYRTFNNHENKVTQSAAKRAAEIAARKRASLPLVRVLKWMAAVIIAAAVFSVVRGAA